MATYKSYAELQSNQLQYKDRVIFEYEGYKIVAFVGHCGLININGNGIQIKNDVFKLLGLDPFEFCEQHYTKLLDGWEWIKTNGSNRWPSYCDNDFESITKAVLELFRIIEQRQSPDNQLNNSHIQPQTETMRIPSLVNPKDFQVGVIIGRFQTPQLHEGHKQLIRSIIDNHQEVVIFLGVSAVQFTRNNPLDFQTRKLMVESYINTVSSAKSKNITILPLPDHRSDEVWTKNLDKILYATTGGKTCLLYGGRDSFLTAYSGKHKTVELESNIHNLSSTELRNGTLNFISQTTDYTTGFTQALHRKFPTSYQTVDVAPLRNNNEVLLAKKAGEDKWRFIGGFVDVNDTSLEYACRREFKEETGGCEIDGIQYVSSHRVDDWRYKGTGDSIMTTLFKSKFIFGHPKAADDIEELKWFSLNSFNQTYGTIETVVIEEHVPLMKSLLKSCFENK